MDFYELNKKMNDSEYQCNEAEMTLKAHGGDRARNLEGIANEIDKHSDYISDEFKQHTLPFILNYAQLESHRLKGYAEQLRIIADELRSSESGRQENTEHVTEGWADRNVHTINNQFAALFAMVKKLSKEKAAVRGQALDKIRSRLDALEASLKQTKTL